ncbi:MAG: AAA family ATPase [Polyangia bacterium]
MNESLRATQGEQKLAHEERGRPRCSVPPTSEPGKPARNRSADALSGHFLDERIASDLKPSNVLVVRNEVKLLDFGISAGATEGVTELAGTFDYMAPELLKGAAPTVASDLYAVGVILHQLLTGSLPQERGAAAAWQAGSGTEPLAPQDPDGATLKEAEPVFSLTAALGRLDDLELNPLAEPELEIQVEGALGEVVRRLLHRNPAMRYEDADAVLRELAAAVNLDIPLETSETRESFLRATALIGRETELATLRSALEQAKAGQGGALLLGGESGVGKSRLLSELRTLALVYGCWASEGQAITEGGTYYNEWIPLLRALSLRAELTDAEAAVFKPLVPDIERLLDRTVPDAAAAKPEELQARLTATLRSVLARLTRPAVIILEDLHWARAESLTLLQALLKDIRSLPVLLIGTYRSDESADLPSRLPGHQLLPLSRLDTEAIARLSESMLGEVGRQPELVDYLTRQTEGNVFFLVEIVRSLAEDAGELRRIGQGELPDSVLTAGIGRIIERRIDRIEPGYRPVLDLAATLGRRLDLPVLQQIFPSLPLRPLLLSAANAAVLETQGSDWRFSHDKLREAILRRIEPVRSARLHAELAEALEVCYSGEERERRSAELALHFTQAGHPERALPYYILAGDRAARLGLLSESRAHYRNALAALPPRPSEPAQQRQRIDLLLKLMQNSLVADPLDAQLERVGEAQALLDALAGTAGTPPPAEDRLRQVRLDYYTGRAYYYVGQTAEAIRRYQRVLPLAQEFGDAELTAMPAAVTGMALLVQGHIGKAHQMLCRALGPLRELGNEFEVVRCREYIGLALAMMGRYTEGLAELSAAEARAKELNQPQLLFIARLLRTIAHRAGMDWEAMLDLVVPIGVAVDKLGEKTYGAVAWSLAAWAHAQLGRHEEARTVRTKALGLAAEFNGKYLGADWFAASDAEAALLAGRPEEALTIARGVAERSRAAGLPQSLGIAERAAGAALAQLGADPNEVSARMEQSLRAFADGELVLDAAQTYLAWAECDKLRGDLEAASQHADEARRRLVSGGCERALRELASRLPQLSGAT